MPTTPDLDAIRTYLGARVAPGWYGLAVPDHWLPHLAELDAQLAQIAPDYVIYQVKEKFGGLRYYIDNDTFEPACCPAWSQTHPYPETGDDTEWCAASDEHDASDEHAAAYRELEARNAATERLISDAEHASYEW